MKISQVLIYLIALLSSFSEKGQMDLAVVNKIISFSDLRLDRLAPVCRTFNECIKRQMFWQHTPAHKWLAFKMINLNQCAVAITAAMSVFPIMDLIFEGTYLTENKQINYEVLHEWNSIFQPIIRQEDAALLSTIINTPQVHLLISMDSFPNYMAYHASRNIFNMLINHFLDTGMDLESSSCSGCHLRPVWIKESVIKRICREDNLELFLKYQSQQRYPIHFNNIITVLLESNSVRILSHIGSRNYVPSDDFVKLLARADKPLIFKYFNIRETVIGKCYRDALKRKLPNVIAALKDYKFTSLQQIKQNLVVLNKF